MSSQPFNSLATEADPMSSVTTVMASLSPRWPRPASLLCRESRWPEGLAPQNVPGGGATAMLRPNPAKADDLRDALHVKGDPDAVLVRDS